MAVMDERWKLRMKYVSRIEEEYERRSDLIVIIEDLIDEVLDLGGKNGK